jgi:hypothetical protein
MAVQRFANIKPPAGVDTLLWDVTKQALVSVVAVNIGGTTKISAYVEPSEAESPEDQSPDDIYYIDDAPLKNRDTFETFKLAVNIGDKIYVSSESGDVSFFTNGIYDKNGTTDVHVGVQAPEYPVVGTIWINESNPDDTRVQVFDDNGNFIDVGVAGPTGPTGAVSTIPGPTGPQGTFDVVDAAPENPEEGDVWFNSSDGRFYVYYDGFWIEALSNEAGPTGPTGPAGQPGTPGEPGPAGSAATSPSLEWVSGESYRTPTTSLSTIQPVLNRTYFTPHFVPATTSIDQITIFTDSGFSGTSSIRLGIYADNGGEPGDLILDAGLLSATAELTGYTKTISQTLDAGVYWMAINVQAQSGISNIISITNSLIFGNRGLGSFQSCGLILPDVAGAFANATGAFSGISSGVSNTPMVFLRKA